MDSATRADFAKRLETHLASDDGRKAFVRFLDGLSRIDDLVECIALYFNVTRDDEKRPRSLGAFYELAKRALAVGNVYFALRFESLIVHTDTPWRRRFRSLETRLQNQLTQQIGRSKRALSPTQKAFLGRFDKYVVDPDPKGFTEWVLKLEFEPLKDCLLSYIEVSQRLADNDRNSLNVFFVVSFRALGLGTAYFALEYETNVRSSGSVWKRRYDALAAWQRDEKLAPAIREKKLIVSAVTGPKGKQGTIRAPLVGAPAPALAQPDDQRPAPAISKAEHEFTRKFTEFMADGGKNKVVEFTDWIFKNPFPKLEEFMRAYLREATKYGDDTKSLYVFVGLASRLLGLGDPYHAKKFKLALETPETPLAKRFAALERQALSQKEIDWQKRQITDAIAKQQQRSRIIDDLKFAYFTKHKKDPTKQALRNFPAPVSNENLELLRRNLSNCHRAFDSKGASDFSAAFEAFSYFLKAHTDLLQLLGLVQECRAVVGGSALLRNQLAWYATGALLIRARQTRAEAYIRGLSVEERDFLFDEADYRDPYFGEFAYRVEYFWLKNQSHDEFTQTAKAQAGLLLTANRFGMRLVPPDETAAVIGLVAVLRKKKPRYLRRIRIPINSRIDPKKTLALNETLDEKAFIVWWDPKQGGEAYVGISGFSDFALDGFNGVLFAADHYHRLGALYDDAVYGAIYRNTQHILELLPTYFRFLLELVHLLTFQQCRLLGFALFADRAYHAIKNVGEDPASVFLLGLELLSKIPRKRAPPVNHPGPEPDLSHHARASMNRMTAGRGTPHADVHGPDISRRGLNDAHTGTTATHGTETHGTGTRGTATQGTGTHGIGSEPRANTNAAPSRATESPHTSGNSVPSSRPTHVERRHGDRSGSHGGGGGGPHGGGGGGPHGGDGGKPPTYRDVQRAEQELEGAMANLNKRDLELVIARERVLKYLKFEAETPKLSRHPKHVAERKKRMDSALKAVEHARDAHVKALLDASRARDRLAEVQQAVARARPPANTYQTRVDEVIGTIPATDRPAPTVAPGGTTYGQLMEPAMERLMRDRFPHTEFFFARGRKGPDVEWTGRGEYPGFHIGDFKPDSPSGRTKFTSQFRREWGGGRGAPPGGPYQAAMFAYRPDGSVVTAEVNLVYPLSRP